MANSDITDTILQTIDILESLETLMDSEIPPEVAKVLQEAWLKISETFPEDFKAATRKDAGAEGLRLYIRMRAFFNDPLNHPISQQDLETYYCHHSQPIDEDSAEFFFPD